MQIDLALPLVRCLHGIKAVEQQVDEDLLELDAISPNLGKISLHHNTQCHMVGPHLRFEQRRGLLDEFQRPDRLEAQLSVLEQRTHPLDHGRRPLIVFLNIGQDLPDLPKVRRILSQEGFARLGVAQNRPQRLVELMCQRRGELTQNEATLYACKLAAMLFRLGFELLSRRDVHGHAANAQRLPSLAVFDLPPSG